MFLERDWKWCHSSDITILNKVPASLHKICNGVSSSTPHGTRHKRRPEVSGTGRGRWQRKGRRKAAKKSSPHSDLYGVWISLLCLQSSGASCYPYNETQSPCSELRGLCGPTPRQPQTVFLTSLHLDFGHSDLLVVLA